MASHLLIVVELILADLASSRLPSRILREPILSVITSKFSSICAEAGLKEPFIVKVSEEFKSERVISLTPSEMVMVSFPSPEVMVAPFALATIESLPLPALIESAPFEVIVSLAAVACTTQFLSVVIIF